jgi:ribose/xylose/arabinose/galactoside ABC-type transport system permease subunit
LGGNEPVWRRGRGRRNGAGVIFVGLLQNGLSIGGIPSFWQQIVTGAILVLAVGVGTLTGADSALLKWRIRRLADLRETSQARGREMDETR